MAPKLIPIADWEEWKIANYYDSAWIDYSDDETECDKSFHYHMNNFKPISPWNEWRVAHQMALKRVANRERLENRLGLLRFEEEELERGLDDLRDEIEEIEEQIRALDCD